MPQITEVEGVQGGVAITLEVNSPASINVSSQGAGVNEWTGSGSQGKWVNGGNVASTVTLTPQNLVGVDSVEILPSATLNLQPGESVYPMFRFVLPVKAPGTSTTSISFDVETSDPVAA